MKKINFLLLVIMFVFLLTINVAYSGQKIYEYGFENWTGDRYTTDSYPFSSTYVEYCQEHDNGSEVVMNYNGWLPHSGNYFFLRNDSPDYSLSPAVDGITAGDVNDVANIGLNGAACSTNPFEISSDINTGEIFIRFWARMSPGFQTIEDNGRMKWIRIYDNTGQSVLMSLATGDGNDHSYMYLYTSADSWVASAKFIENAYDGNWHKYSMYVNFNTGMIKGWYDTANEILDNSTIEWTAGDGQIGSATAADHFIIQGNFSAKSPTEITYHALDDIEVWDGLPDSGTVTIIPPHVDAPITIE